MKKNYLLIPVYSSFNYNLNYFQQYLHKRILKFFKSVSNNQLKRKKKENK